jgi:hypothetical protein
MQHSNCFHPTAGSITRTAGFINKQQVDDLSCLLIEIAVWFNEIILKRGIL